MEGVELRSRRGKKDEKVRRSYSCSDLSQLLGLPREESADELGETEENGASCSPREKVKSEASESEVVSQRFSALVKIRRWQSSRKKKVDSPMVISAPLQPSELPAPNKLTTLIPPNINLNNPFGTIGRRGRRKQNEAKPIVVLEKCFGPPPSSTSTLPTLNEHSPYHHPFTNPFGTLPRTTAKRMGVANHREGPRDLSAVSFLPPSISVSHSPSPSPSSSRSPSISPSHSPSHSLSDALTVIDKRASTNLTAPSYHSLLGKSMERLPMQGGMEPSSGVGPFAVELGADCREFELSSNQSAHTMLENPESETRWYFKYFLGKVHHNYLCYDTDKNPFFLSVVNSGSVIRCILWRNTGCKRLSIREGSNGKMPSIKSLLEKFSVNKYDKSIKEVATEKIQKEFLTMEEQEGSVNFKFGVLYAKTGQTTDNQMYGNESGSGRFSCFLELLGDEVALEGWQNFRGGLDVKRNTTGATSVFTVFEGHEIMFHVSTLLPYSSGNEQQLERKRHLGNDIVVIIFIDGENPEDAYESCLTFDPSCMKSHFNHIFALVTFDQTKNAYRLVMHSAESVPRFGPSLPAAGVFSDPSAFRDFLLTKLINGEKAAYCTPTFSEKRKRTLNLLLKDVEHKCTTEYRRTLSVPALRPPQPSPGTSRKYAEMQQNFTDYGQRLKVEKIITGHHPTSQRTTVSPKRDPWEPISITEDFPYKIVCGDYCDDGTLIVSTESDGTYFLYKDGSYTLMLNKTVAIGQVVVAHKHHLLLFRTAYAKESNYLYAIPLRHFYSEKIILDNKSSLAAYQIASTKGCHLFCTAPLSGQFLRVAVACKAKVYMLAWKHPALSSSSGGVPLAPQAPSNPAESFIKHRDLALPDVPIMMTLLDERPSGKLCVSYQKQTVVDAVDEIKATTQRIPNLDIAKAKLICLTSVYSNGHSELLIGYNLTSQLITLHDGTAYNSAEVVWNSEPKDIVCMTPYMLGFMANTLEIRMASNGSLIQTINIPDLQLITSKGDIYFTSSSLIHNYRGDSRIVIPSDTKFPKNVDRRGFLSSGRSEPELPRMVYVYKISSETLLGRRDSIASADEVFTRSTMGDDGDSTALDSILNSESDLLNLGVRSGSFTVGGAPVPPSQTMEGGRGGSGRRKGGGRKFHRSGEVEPDTASVSSTSEYSSHVSLESSVCSSPDSDTHEDLQLSTGGMRRNGSGCSSGPRPGGVISVSGGKGGLHFHIIPSHNSPNTNS